MNLIKFCFYVAALEFMLALLVFFGTLLVIVLVRLIRAFCEWCFDFFFNKEDRHEP